MRTAMNSASADAPRSGYAAAAFRKTSPSATEPTADRVFSRPSRRETCPLQSPSPSLPGRTGPGRGRRFRIPPVWCKKGRPRVRQNPRPSYSDYPTEKKLTMLRPQYKRRSRTRPGRGTASYCKGRGKKFQESVTHWRMSEFTLQQSDSPQAPPRCRRYGPAQLLSPALRPPGLYKGGERQPQA